MMRIVIVCVYKQKTAYEVRISDWSSDVCSSDLGKGARPGRRGRGRKAPPTTPSTPPPGRVRAGCAHAAPAPEGRRGPLCRVPIVRRQAGSGPAARRERKRGVEGKRGAVGVETDGSRSLKKKINNRANKIV